ncbi:MAG: hypothetical protein ACP5IX_01765 [Patescibacteria group bacterium]
MPEVYSLTKLYKLEKYIKLMLAEKLDRKLIKNLFKIFDDPKFYGRGFWGHRNWK